MAAQSHPSTVSARPPAKGTGAGNGGAGRTGRRILVLSPVCPDPEGRGPGRRLSACIEALGRTGEVTLVVVAGGGYAPAGGLSPEYLEGRWRIDTAPLVNGRTWRGRFSRRWAFVHLLVWRRPFAWADLPAARRRRVAALVAGLGEFDIIHAYRLCMVETARELCARRRCRARLWLDMDDIESLSHRRMGKRFEVAGELRRAAEYRWTAVNLAILERWFLPDCDRVFVCSEDDRMRLAGEHPGVRRLPNIASLPEPDEAGGGAGRDVAGAFRFLFIGTLDYPPNQEALAWLGTEIWPRLRDLTGGGLVVAGYGKPGAAGAWLKGAPGVEYLGAVERSAHAFARADALLVPLCAGGGTRLKILEAFARGCPVVGTALAVEGIEAEAETHFLRAETTDDFVRQAARLASDPALGKRLADAARELWRDDYSPAALDRVVADLLD